MPEIIQAPAQPPHPILIVRQAVVWARAAGLRVRLGSWGVMCVSSLSAERWALDPREDGVDPLGAAVLHAQPDSTAIYEAASLALSAPLPFVHGLVDGLDGEVSGRRWPESIHRALYATGFESGARYRAELLRTPLRAVQ